MLLTVSEADFTARAALRDFEDRAFRGIDNFTRFPSFGFERASDDQISCRDELLRTERSRTMSAYARMLAAVGVSRASEPRYARPPT